MWGQKQQFFDRTRLTPRACCMHARLNLIAITKQSLKNPTYDFRGTIANPKYNVSPWMNSTYEPDYNVKPLC